jgi:hypothetical protein
MAILRKKYALSSLRNLLPKNSGYGLRVIIYNCIISKNAGRWKRGFLNFFSG